MAEVVLRERDLRHLSEVLGDRVPRDPPGLLPVPLLLALQALVPCGWVGVWEEDPGTCWRLRLIELPEALLEPTQQACLTVQERRVLRLVAIGRSNEQIARELSVASSTVRKHLEHAFRKLGVTRRSAAVAVTFPHGVASLSGPDERAPAGPA